MTSTRGLRLWLGAGVRLPKTDGTQYQTADGATGELRGYQGGRRIRLTHRPPGARHETIVQTTIAPKTAGTTLQFHQERMRSAKERERQRAHWQSVMDDVEDALARSTPAKKSGTPRVARPARSAGSTRAGGRRPSRRA